MIVFATMRVFFIIFFISLISTFVLSELRFFKQQTNIPENRQPNLPK